MSEDNNVDEVDQAEALMLYTAKMTIRERIWLFTEQFEGIERGREVDTGKYKYSYFNIDDVYAAAVPLMSRCGIGATDQVKMLPDGGAVLVVEVFNLDGGSACAEMSPGQYGQRSPDSMVTSEMPLPATNDGRAFGSALTFMRRYGLVTMLNIRVPGDDDDGLTAEMDRLANEAGSAGSKLEECRDLVRQIDNGDERALQYVEKKWGLSRLDDLSLKQAASLKRTLTDLVRQEATADGAG